MPMEKKLIDMAEYAKLSPMMTNWWTENPKQVLWELYEFYKLKDDISYAIDIQDIELLQKLNEKIRHGFYKENLF